MLTNVDLLTGRETSDTMTKNPKVSDSNHCELSRISNFPLN